MIGPYFVSVHDFAACSLRGGSSSSKRRICIKERRLAEISCTQEQGGRECTIQQQFPSMFDLNELPDAVREQQLLSQVTPADITALQVSDDDGIAKPGIVKGLADLLATPDAVTKSNIPSEGSADRFASFEFQRPFSTKLLSRGDGVALDTAVEASALVSPEPEVDRTTKLLPISIRSGQKEPLERARASSCHYGEETDLLNIRANRSQSNVETVADASLSRKSDSMRQDLLEKLPVKDQHDNQTRTLSLITESEACIEFVKDAGKASEGSSTCLALGSIFQSSSYDSKLQGETQQFLSSSKRQSPRVRPKKPDPYGLALGRAAGHVFTSKQTTDASPFWRGKFRTEGPLLSRVVAYCLGDMKPDSRLKKLPEILSSRKLVKMEEFQEILRYGVAEPFTQFKPSPDASLEEVQRFNSTVEALSGGSGLMQHDYQLDLELGQQSSPVGTTLGSSAAVISLEEDAEYSSDVKLYLISPPSFQTVLENWSPKMSICALEEIDVLDHVSLYGFFCHSSASTKTCGQDLFHKSKLDDIRKESVRPSGKELLINLSSVNVSSIDTGKDIDATNSTKSCLVSLSNVDEVVVASDILAKSAVMEPNQTSPGVDAGNSRTELEEGGKEGSPSAELKESKKYHHGHRASSKRKHEVEKGKKHSKRSSRGDNVSEEDVDKEIHNQQAQSKERDRGSWSRSKSKDSSRHFQRQERHSERFKEHDTFWWSREDRDLGKNRGKERQRDPVHESEKGRKSRERGKDSDREKLWDREKGRHRERSTKDKILDEQKIKPGTERGITGTKSNLALSHEGGGSADEQGVRKESRKREGGDEKDSHGHSKRLRETKLASVQDSDQAIRDGNRELKNKSEVEDVDQELGRSHKELEPSNKLVSMEAQGESQHGSDARPDSTLVKESEGFNAWNLESKLGNHLMANPATSHDENVEGTAAVKGELKNLSLLPSQMEDVGVMNAGNEVRRTPVEKVGDSTDGAPLKVDDGTADSPMAKVEGEEVSCEFILDGFDRETRTWLTSKQSALYLQEEYGVNAIIQAEISKSHPGSKVELQKGSLHVRISMPISDSCEATEAKWFVNQAADVVRSIASHGVFIKCLWYQGPVQLQSGDGAPSVPAVVKKIKGDDGKNLERMQDVTGVMIGVVLRKGVVGAAHELNSMPRFIGLRLKCIRRKGLLEASKQAEALLVCVADHFSKELAAIIGDLQEIGLHPSELNSNGDSPSSRALTASTKDFLANSPAKLEDPFTGHLPLVSLNFFDNNTPLSTLEEPNSKLYHGTPSLDEEPEFGLYPEVRGGSSRPLYVSNLPENVTPIKIRNIFESVLKEKLGLPSGLERGSDLVVDVRYRPDKFCAFVELATDNLLNASLKLYGEDRTVFRGLKVELGLAATSKTDRQGLMSRGEVRSRGFSTDSNPEQAKFAFALSGRSKAEELGGKRYGVSSTESDSDFSHAQWYGEDDALKADHTVDKPKPLFLTELMRNASAQTIKQLFEDIITKYISPSLVSSSGRQLVLDVRYVPSRGCAFVDLATPELVEFMLDLHSRRPEVFYHMKMELGRRPVPHSVEDDTDRRSNMHNRDTIRGKPRSYGPTSGAQLYGYRNFSSPGSRRQAERRLDVTYREYDYIEDSDKGDDFTRQTVGLRKRRSDPEKTVYADRLPENASEGMIRRIFERVLFQHMTQEQRDVLGDHIITEVRYVPTKYCAFIVFVAEELTRLVLHLYNQDEDIFEKMRLKPHFHSRMEDLYRDDLQERDDDVHLGSARDRVLDHEIDDYPKSQHVELYDARSRSSAHRAIAATAFKEVDRRRSVYVDRIPEKLSEAAMREMFEKVFRRKRHGYDCQMVSQVTFFRDKFDPNKLCAFVEVRNEDATQDLIDCYNANEDAFLGMRVRPALKYNN